MSDRYTTSPEERKNLHRISAAMFIFGGLLCCCFSFWSYLYGQATESWATAKVRLEIGVTDSYRGGGKNPARYSYRVAGKTYFAHFYGDNQESIYYDPKAPWKAEWYQGVLWGRTVGWLVLGGIPGIIGVLFLAATYFPWVEKLVPFDLGY